MSTRKLSNVSLREYRTFLAKAGCTISRTTGGHEHWTKPGLLRPITVQTHVDPVPEFIILNALRTLGVSKADFWAILDKK